MIRIAAALALLAAGCEASIPACPGSAQGTFRLGGVAVEAGTTCPFSLAAIAAARAAGTVPTFDVQATVSWLDAGTAAVCVQEPMASPLVGPRTGDAFTASIALGGLTIASCPCPVDLLETITGTLQRSGAIPSGLTGSLVDRFTRTAGSDACYAAADPSAVASGCPGAPDPAAVPPSDGGCDALWDVASHAGP